MHDCSVAIVTGSHRPWTTTWTCFLEHDLSHHPQLTFHAAHSSA